jgi:hypothetical protein
MFIMFGLPQRGAARVWGMMVGTSVPEEDVNRRCPRGGRTCGNGVGPMAVMQTPDNFGMYISYRADEGDDH